MRLACCATTGPWETAAAGSDFSQHPAHLLQTPYTGTHAHAVLMHVGVVLRAHVALLSHKLRLSAEPGGHSRCAHRLMAEVANRIAIVFLHSNLHRPTCTISSLAWVSRSVR